MKRCLALLALAFSVLAATPAPAQQDQIFGKTGTPIRGTIVGISPTSVRIATTGVTRDIEVREIQKLVFGDEPADVGTAREQALAGQYENALASLKKVNLAEIQTDAVKQEAGYYAAYCNAKLALTAGGDRRVARDGLFEFIRANPATYHFFEAAQLLGDLSFALNEYAEASKYYGALAKADWPEYKMRAAVLQARAQSAEGKFAEAMAAYDQILASGLNTPEAVEQKMQASVGRAVCLAATGRHKKANKNYSFLNTKNKNQ